MWGLKCKKWEIGALKECCRGSCAVFAQPRQTSDRNPLKLPRLKCRGQKDRGSRATEIHQNCRGPTAAQTNRGNKDRGSPSSRLLEGILPYFGSHINTSLGFQIHNTIYTKFHQKDSLFTSHHPLTPKITQAPTFHDSTDDCL